jgi:uncharacterized protein (DUF433 family)
MNKTKSKYISSTPAILGGMPVIVGTRIPISRILFLLKDGYTLEAIADDYSWVDKKKIAGAINEVIKTFENPMNVSTAL